MNDFLLTELKLTDRVVGIRRLSEGTPTADIPGGCTLKVLNRVLAGETIVLSAETTGCGGGKIGFGFVDGIPNTPGGFGYFISQGRGEGYPPGEHMKASGEIGEQMILNQPQQVMTGKACIELCPYQLGENYELVTVLANPDQLSTLINVFTYRKSGYEDVIAPLVSGCASVFRLPFGELAKAEPRAVIGGVDVASRPYFPADSFFLTVSGRDFDQMLVDADDSVLIAPLFRGVKKRL